MNEHIKINDIIRTKDKYNRYFVSTMEIDRVGNIHSFRSYLMPSINYYWFDTFIDACKYYIKKRKYVVHKSLGIRNRQNNKEFIIRNTQWEDDENE